MLLLEFLAAGNNPPFGQICIASKHLMCGHPCHIQESVPYGRRSNSPKDFLYFGSRMEELGKVVARMIVSVSAKKVVLIPRGFVG